MKPRVIFFSADEISKPCLEFLRTEPSIAFCGIVTQPQRAKGRGQTVSLNPIAQWAQTHALPFYQAETMNDAAFDWLKQIQPHLVLVMAFGHILKKRFLELPKLGMWNLHVSLLPKYRGASPVQAALLNGDAETGVTLMSMVEVMDAGAWTAQQKTAIAPDDTAVTLREKLAQASAALLRTSLPALLSETYVLTPQNEADATYCKKLSKADGYLDFSKPAAFLERCIRAYQPWPGAYFLKNNERYLVHRAHVSADGTARNDLLFPTASTSVKDKLSANADGTHPTYGQFLTDPHRTVLAVTTGEDLLVVDRIQKAGGKPMNAAEFLRGNRHFLET